MVESFKVALTGRIRNGLLWQAVEKLGSIQALADHLDLNYQSTVSLVNMKWYPMPKTRQTERWQQIADRLLLLTGATLDEIFPPELAEMSERPLKFSAIKEVPMLALSEANHLFLPPAQEIEIERDEMKDAIESALHTLSDRQQYIIKHRFGIDCEPQTLEEISQHFGVSRDRIRQIETKALIKLRHPSITRNLKNFMEE